MNRLNMDYRSGKLDNVNRKSGMPQIDAALPPSTLTSRNLNAIKPQLSKFVGPVEEGKCQIVAVLTRLHLCIQVA
jgi:hypothetical protein